MSFHHATTLTDYARTAVDLRIRMTETTAGRVDAAYLRELFASRFESVERIGLDQPGTGDPDSGDPHAGGSDAVVDCVVDAVAAPPRPRGATARASCWPRR